MKIRETTSIGFDFECYPGHDPEQYLRGFSCWPDTLSNVKVNNTVNTFKSYNSKCL